MNLNLMGIAIGTRSRDSGLPRNSGYWLVAWLMAMWPCGGLAQVSGTALVGEPFGVAAFTVALGPESVLRYRTNGYCLLGGEGRVFHPVFTTASLPPLLARWLPGSDGLPQQLTVLFLFRGNEPLELSIDVGRPQPVRLMPESSGAVAFRRLQGRWWRGYCDQLRSWADEANYPPIHDYNSSILASRLGLSPPLFDRPKRGAASDLGLRTLELMLGLEPMRRQLREDTLRGQAERTEVPELPLPPPVAWQEPIWGDEAEAEVEVEAISLRVPHDCFYVRFGSFENNFWFTNLIESFGGDLGAMIQPIAVRRDMSERMQQQLGVRQHALAELVGPAIVSDVAMLGHDLYMDDGPALGILFQARNPLLGTAIMQQRRAELAKNREFGAREETVTLSGRPVSLFSTPDNRLRSFYVADGEFHLVANSRTIVEEFLEIGAGRPALGGTREFQRARQRFPLTRNDTLFAYFSTAFLQRLASPHYQIERERRLRAATDVQLLALAELAARAEQHPAGTTMDLVDAGLLPATIAVRPEGGEIVHTPEGWLDTLRGVSGFFLPIPDVALEQITPREAAEYQARADYYRAHWKQFDPLMVGVQRFALDDQGRERIMIEAQISPLDAGKYGWLLSILGPSVTQRVAPAPGDVVAIQAFVQGGLLAPLIPTHQLFLGIQDSPLRLKPTGFLGWLQVLRSTPGYLGATPKPGFLDWLPLGLGGGPPDDQGYSQLPLLGIWRRQWAGFSTLSLQRGVLDAVTPHLALEEATQPAQLRAYVGDLSQSQLKDWINDLALERALRASLTNVRFAHGLAEQYRLPRDQALAETARLLGGELVCPLGGKYELQTAEGQTPVWVSTAWQDSAAPPKDYQAPLLVWFRGANVDLSRTSEGLTVRAEVDMQRKAQDRSGVLPLFNLFQGNRPSAAPRTNDAPSRQRRF